VKSRMAMARIDWNMTSARICRGGGVTQLATHERCFSTIQASMKSRHRPSEHEER
jgi:hypothetical protein